LRRNRTITPGDPIIASYRKERSSWKKHRPSLDDMLQKLPFT
jgi:hypothetical protein